MKSTPSPRARFLAVLALILLAGGGAYLLINGSSSANGTAGTQTTLQKTTTHSQTTAKQKTTAKKSKKSTKSKKSKHRAPAEGVNALDAALVRHPLVVVSVYARNAVIDTQAMKEAQAGAARVGAGFVAFNVFSEKIARQLADLLGTEETSSPEVLFFRRERKLVFRLHGFADSQVVAQAAKNVLPYSEPWISKANGICGRFSAPLATALGKAESADQDTAAGRSQAAAALSEAANVLRKERKSLSAVRANVGSAKDLARVVTHLRQIATNMRSEAAALRKNDTETAKKIDLKNATLITSADLLATNLQIASCVP
jgi:hypothetical protein